MSRPATSRPASSQPTPTPDLAQLLSRRPPPEHLSPRDGVGVKVPTALPSVSLEPDPPHLTSGDDRQPQSAAAENNRGDDIGAHQTRTYLRSITVYLPRELSEQLAAAAEEAATTRTALLLTAVNATHSRVVAALQSSAARTNGQQRDADGLFDIPQARRGVAPASVQTTIRVTDSQLDALNHLARQAGVPRSRVLAEALQLYLPATNPVVRNSTTRSQ